MDYYEENNRDGFDGYDDGYETFGDMMTVYTRPETAALRSLRSRTEAGNTVRQERCTTGWRP